MRSSKRVQKLIFIVFGVHVVIDIQTLTDDVEGKSTSEGKAYELLRTLIVVLCTDAPDLLFQQGSQDVKVFTVIDLAEDAFLDVIIDVFQPQPLLNLTGSPFVVTDLVLDEGTGIASST